MDSFHSDSPTNQSESWEFPPSQRKHLIPDSSIIDDHRASLRSAKKFVETTKSSVQANQVSELSASAVGLDFPLTKVAHPVILAPEIRHHEEEIEKVRDFFAPENDAAEMVNESIQMEGNNDSFEAECIPFEQEHLALDNQVQASSISRPRKRADKKNNRKTISMVGHLSSLFSPNLTEMVNMCDNEDDEVTSIGPSSPMNTVEVEGYQVRPEYESILRKILTKYGDIFKDSTISTTILRSMLLEMICDTISYLQDKDIYRITEDEVHSIIALVNEIQNIKVDIKWLHLRLEDIHKADS